MIKNVYLPFLSNNLTPSFGVEALIFEWVYVGKSKARFLRLCPDVCTEG